MNFSKGIKVRFTAEGKDVLSQSLVLKGRKIAFLPGVEESEIRKWPRRLQQAGLFFFKTADKENVTNAFMSGYMKGKSLNLPKDWAIRMGDEVAANTQFLYTKMARSLFEGSALGRFLTPFTSWPRNWMELMAKWFTGRRSQVLADYFTETGIRVVDPGSKAKEAISYLALVTLAQAAERTTPLRVTEYTGVTSIRSLAQFAGGELPSLGIVQGLAEIVAGTAILDEKMVRSGWNIVKPGRMIGIARQLEQITTGKQDWLSLFLFLNRQKESKGRPKFRKFPK